MRFYATSSKYARYATCVTTLLTAAISLSGAERNFSYVQESAVLAPGQKELELWTTLQGGRADQDFQRLDSRLELEVGVAPDTQIAMYLNHRRTSENGVAESEFEGVSLELKRRLSDPVADAMGSAIYVEGTVNGSETELELKGITDWRAGSWIIAANAIVEFEWAQTPNAAGDGATTEDEQQLGLTLAAARSLGEGWSAGFEIDNRNPIEEGEWESSTLWAGPVVHVANPHLWATLTVMPQLTNLGGEAETGTRELGDHSRIEARLLLGTHF